MLLLVHPLTNLRVRVAAAKTIESQNDVESKRKLPGTRKEQFHQVSILQRVTKCFKILLGFSFYTHRSIIG